MHTEYRIGEKISSSKFSKEDKKAAISAFSDCHKALFFYVLITGAVVFFILLVTVLFFGYKTIEILGNPYFLAGAQILSMYVIGFPAFCIMVKDMPTAYRTKSTVRFGEYISLFLIALALMQLGSIVSYFVSDYLNSHVEMFSPTSFPLNMLQAGSAVPDFLVVVILAPIIEEIMFRKLIIDRLSIYGDRLAVIVSSVAFGLFHGNVSQLFFAIFVGFILGYLYTKTGRLVYSWLLHTMINFVVSAQALLYELYSNAAPEYKLLLEHAIEIVPVVQAVFIALGAILLVRAILKKSYPMSQKCDIEIPKAKLLRVAVLNSGTMLYFAYSVIVILYPFLANNAGF